VTLRMPVFVEPTDLGKNSCVPPGNSARCCWGGRRKL